MNEIADEESKKRLNSSVSIYGMSTISYSLLKKTANFLLMKKYVLDSFVMTYVYQDGSESIDYRSKGKNLREVVPENALLTGTLT